MLAGVCLAGMQVACLHPHPFPHTAGSRGYRQCNQWRHSSLSSGDPAARVLGPDQVRTRGVVRED